MALLYRMGTGNGSGGDLKPYIVQFTCDSGYIGQTLTMTYKGTPHAGETVDNVSGTVVLDSTDGKGKLTLYPMHSGNWECSCYSSVIGTTMKKTIELSYWGTTNVEFNDIPDGATATPTDDVQTWLHCANIWDKSYTTIAEVIADTTTLNTLINDNNASDYLVRSTTWANDICNNESAMTYIGLYDYCANKLLADSTWLEAIYNSTYSKKVLNVNIPTMTQNVESFGTANASSVFGNTIYPPYKAFDNDDNTFWLSDNGVSDAYITYNFNKDVTIYFIDLINNMSDAYNGSIYSVYVYADDTEIFKLENNAKVFSLLKQKVTQKKCRTLKVRVVGNGRYVSMSTIQVYGREA